MQIGIVRQAKYFVKAMLICNGQKAQSIENGRPVAGFKILAQESCLRYPAA